nr:MAG TPA: hypothetical protein [Caudoviricetes sp.]
MLQAVQLGDILDHLYHLTTFTNADAPLNSEPLKCANPCTFLSSYPTVSYTSPLVITVTPANMLCGLSNLILYTSTFCSSVLATTAVLSDFSVAALGKLGLLCAISFFTFSAAISTVGACV